MALLTTAQLRAVQRIGESMFSTSVSIYKRQPYAHDDSNPYGDDTVTYATTAVVVTGWLVPEEKADFSTNVAQIVTSGRFMLRLPAGTDIGPGDRCTIDGLSYAVAESSIEQTWPEWLNVHLRRIQ